MTIGKRITLGFATLVALLIGVGVYSAHKFSETSESATTIKGALPSLLAADEMLVRTLENYSLLQSHILTSDEKLIAEIEEKMKANSAANVEAAEKYKSMVDSDEERDLLAKYDDTRKQMVETRNLVLDASRKNENEKADALRRTKLDPLMANYRAAVNELVSFNVRETNKSVEGVAASASSGRFGAFASIVIGTVAAAAAAFYITRSVGSALNKLADALGEGSGQVSAAATQVSASSQSLAQGASEQAASLEESSSAIEEMASMIKKNADTSQQANAFSDEAKQAADAGTDAMSKMSAAIVDIERASQETAKIIKTIDEIAFQTNLLALNAAVEAARAGEAGKGFAVVAEEVRNLAMRSAEAAKNTSSLIEESVAKAKNGVEIAQTVASNLEQINSSTSKVTGLIAEIAAASKEQATGIDQISGAIGQMDKVTQTNAANAEETAAASEELNAQAEQLQACVGELQTLVGVTATTRSQAKPPTTRAATVRPTKTATAARPVEPKPAKPTDARSLIPLEAHAASVSPTGSGDFSEFSKAA